MYAGTTLNEFVGFLSISKQLKISTNSSINIQGSFSYINDRRFVQVNNLQRPYTNIELFPNFKLSLNLNDVVELSTSINQSWRKTIHKNDVFPNAQTRILRSFNEIVLRLGKHFVWESSADYQYNSSGVGLNSREVLLWNSSLTWLFLQENRAQLKFYAFDILNRNIAFGQSVSENYIYRKSTILLNQFFMITLYYDIRGIKSKDIGGRKQLLLF